MRLAQNTRASGATRVEYTADGTLIFLGNYIYKFREVRHESKIQTVE